MVSLVTVLKGLWAAASARRRHGDVATRRRQSGQVAGLPQNAGRPLTAPPAWCQDPLAMCACSHGCSFEDMRSKLGLDASGHANGGGPGHKTVYFYTDEAGTPVFEVERRRAAGGRGKKFLQRHTAADDAVVWKLPPAGRGLVYHLPAVKRATRTRGRRTVRTAGACVLRVDGGRVRMGPSLRQPSRAIVDAHRKHT